MKRAVVIILLVVAMLFVLAGIAATLFFTLNGGFTSNNPFDVRNISSVLEESKTLKVDPAEPITLSVTDDSGHVTITGADVDTVQVKVIKTAYDSSQPRADQEVKEIRYAIEQTGNKITLKYKLPKSVNFNNKVNSVDFIVTVPHETEVDVKTFGQVNVSGINSSVDVATSFGSVTLENIEGSVDVETQSGRVDASSIDAGGANINLVSGFGTVSLEEASGKDVTLRSQSGTVEMRDVRASGNVDLSTDFGDTEFSRGAANSLSVETNSGKVTLNQLTLRGALSAKSEFGEISLEQVKAASYDLDTSSGSVTADGVLGKLKAHSGFGSVTVKNADSVTLDLSTQSGPVEFEGSLGEGPHSIHSEFGEITLTIPADSALDVDLTTKFGLINSDIPITVILSGEVEQGHQAGTMNEGGDPLTVETGSGSISIQASQ